MKIEVKEKESQLKFPCLMKSDGLIILATETKDGSITGTVINGKGVHCIGEYDNDWDADEFTSFHGTVTLSND